MYSICPHHKENIQVSSFTIHVLHVFSISECLKWMHELLYFSFGQMDGGSYLLATYLYFTNIEVVVKLYFFFSLFSFPESRPLAQSLGSGVQQCFIVQMGSSRYAVIYMTIYLARLHHNVNELIILNYFCSCF